VLKTIGLIGVTLVVGAVLGFTVAVSFSPQGSVDVLAEHPSTRIRLDSPLAVSTSAGDYLQLPAGSLLGLRSIYQDEVTAEIRIVGQLNELTAVASELVEDTEHTYYVD